MAKQTINIGAAANDGTGDPIRAAFGKVNDNFTEIYTANTGVNTGDQNLAAYATTAAVAAGYQPLDSDLTAIAALTTTAYGRALLSTADAPTLRTAIGLGQTDAPTFLAQTLTGQSLTGTQATSLVDLAATWNTDGNPSLIYGRVTNTKSGTTANLIDLGTVAGGSIFKVNKLGNISFPGRYSTASIVTQTINGFAAIKSDWGGGGGAWMFGGQDVNGTVALGGDNIGFNGLRSIDTTTAADIDTRIYRDAAGILAQRNGTNPQAFRVYNTYTDASNYDRLSFFHSSGVATISAEGAGTGLAGSHLALRASGATKAIIFYTAGVERWAINSAGNLTAQTDNAYDIGTSGAYRPRNIYVGSDVICGSLRVVNINTANNSHSVLTFTNSSDNLLFASGQTSSRINFCGTTSAFPAIKRNGTGIDIRLADDSAFAPLNCGNFVANGNIRSTDTALIGWLNTRSAMISPADGVIRLTNNAGTSYTRLELGEANLGISRGTGSPEGVVTALVGSLYLRTDGGLLSTLYVKESSPTPNTGWVAK